MLELKKQDNPLFDMKTGTGNNEQDRLERWPFFMTIRTRMRLSPRFVSSSAN